MPPAAAVAAGVEPLSSDPLEQAARPKAVRAIPAATTVRFGVRMVLSFGSGGTPAAGVADDVVQKDYEKSYQRPTTSLPSRPKTTNTVTPSREATMIAA